VSFFGIFNHVEPVFLFGDNKNVNWGLGTDVSEGKNVVIFVDNVGWNLLSNDFVENGFATHKD
jgi:hypothetical protein